jgi:hypothetical protein
MENMQDGQEESGLTREQEGGHETNAGITILKRKGRKVSENRKEKMYNEEKKENSMKDEKHI